jgi:hypothetical protein
MRLKWHNASFNPFPYLTTPIPEEKLYSYSLKDFDKDGYEVPAPLERMFYDAEGIELNNEIQYHVAPVQPWYTDEDESEEGLVLDHCMLLTRYAFDGPARKQLEQASDKRPILQKLLNITPKWGIDFSLDYVSKEIVMEVIHIEQDFDTLEDANVAKKKLETIIECTDWELGVHQLIERKAEWAELSSDDHSDYKAQFFGWHRAFDNKKVFST